MKRDRGLTLEMALLLALLLEGESYPYELAERFQERFTFLPLETHEVYDPLERLQIRDLVDTLSAKRVSGPRNHRVKYAATETAPDEHEQWLTLPLRSSSWTRQDWRAELLGRIATAGKLETRQLRALIDLYQQNALAEVKIIERLASKVPDRDLVLSLPDPHERKDLLLLRRMVLNEQRLTLAAQAGWAERALAQIESGLPK